VEHIWIGNQKVVLFLKFIENQRKTTVNTLRKQITPTWGRKFNAEICKEQTWESRE
jgi:hypothetical protein